MVLFGRVFWEGGGNLVFSFRFVSIPRTCSIYDFLLPFQRLLDGGMRSDPLIEWSSA